MQAVPFFFAFFNAVLMFYGGEIKNSGSKEMSVKNIDELITTENLKASGFFEYHAKATIVTLHEGQQWNLLVLKQQKKNY